MDCSMPGLPVCHQLQVYSHSCPLSRWCHPTISSSVTPFSSYPQSFPASGSFPVSWLFTSEEDFPKIPRVKSFCLVTRCFIWQFLGRYFSFRGNCCAEKYLKPVLSWGWVFFFFSFFILVYTKLINRRSNQDFSNYFKPSHINMWPDSSCFFRPESLAILFEATLKFGLC